LPGYSPSRKSGGSDRPLSRRKWKEWKQKPQFWKVRWDPKKYGFDFHCLHCASNRQDQPKRFAPDAEDVHLLSINIVEYERSIKTGVKGIPRTINTYDFSADSEQSSL
jgi:hypothetical protein